jgi:hypothetical protein
MVLAARPFEGRTMKNPVVGQVSLFCHRIDGKLYGAARIVVRIGHTPLDAIAVKAGSKKWASTREDCVDWLTRHGLSRRLAIALIDDALDQQKHLEANHVAT